MSITVKLDTVLCDESDQPIRDEKTQQPITVRTTLTKLALADLDGNGQPVRGDDKVKHYELFLKIKAAKDSPTLELTPEEATLLRDGARVFPTLIMGQVRAALA